MKYIRNILDIKFAEILRNIRKDPLNSRERGVFN